MKLSEFKNGDAIDLLADMIDPVTRILGDEEVSKAFQAGYSKLHIAKLCLKKHKDDVIEILALANGESKDTYVCTPITIMRDLIQLLNDKDLMDFFSEQQSLMTTGN